MPQLYVEHIKPIQISETIVMVHGLQSSLRTFDPIIDQLPKDMEIFRLDQRGHGNSPASGDDYTSEAMAKDLHQQIHQSSINRPFHLLGHSMGARTALAYAGLYPEDVKSLIIEDIGMEKRATLELEKLERIKKFYLSYLNHDLVFASLEEIRSILKPLYNNYESLISSKVIKLSNGHYKLLFNPGVASLYGYQGNITDLSWGLENEIPVTFFVADKKIGSAMNDDSIEYIKSKTPRAVIVYFKEAWHNIHKSQTELFTSKLKIWINSIK